MAKHIVFDRDGTLIEHKRYLCIPKEVKLLPYVAEGLAKLKEQGHKLYLHTNQSGVARGYFDYEDAVTCNNEMLRLINLGDDLFERICIAPDYPPLKNTYRKPSPKFGLELMWQFNIAPKKLFYVGDSSSDIETAINLKCKGVGLNTGEFDLEEKCKDWAKLNIPIVKNFENLIDYLDTVKQ